MTEITFFTVIRGVFRGGGYEIFLGIKHFHVKLNSNKNVWVPEQNTQIKTELHQEILYKFINRYIRVIKRLDAV